MKKIISIILLLFVILCISCNKSKDTIADNTSIIGNWKIEKQVTATYRGTTLVKEIKSTEKIQVEFKADGTYTSVSLSNNETYSGAYKFSFENKNFSIKEEDDRVFIDLQVTEFTHNRFVTKFESSSLNSGEIDIETTVFVRL